MSPAPTPPRQTCGPAGDEAPAIRTTLDAAVRPDLFVDRPAAELSRPVQLKAAVVAGEANGERGSGPAAGLPTELRAQMERSLGADFSGVRVREDASAAALGADAYARGEEITFAPGRFDPASTAGKELIGHELVHVVQQRQGRVAATQARGGTAINADAGLEREADELGARAARGEIVGLGSVAGSASTDAAQLRPGKVKAKDGVRVRIESGDVVLLPGTKIDVEGTKVEVLSGLHRGATGTLNEEDVDGFEYLRERDVDTDHVVYPGCSTSFIGLPQAEEVDGEMLVVRAVVQTRNLFDRVRYTIGFQHPDTPEGRGANVATGVRDEDIDDQNPPWRTGEAPIGHPDYEFTPGFEGFEGTGTPSALRIVTVRIPIDRVRGYFLDTLHRWTDTDICIQLGLDMYYGGTGPAVATERERASAYLKTDPRGHQYGFGATSSPQSLGRVTFSGAVLEALGITTGARQEPHEYHAQVLGENPPNSLEQPFPSDYPERHPEILPLVPTRFLERDGEDSPRLGLDSRNTEMQLKLQTRIENEATLKVSTREGLEAIVELLSTWGEDGGDVTELMTHGDPLLRGFTWSLETKKPMVFTDVYLDDERLHALRAGLGIRKRRSKEAAKLNVKTGAGYNVKTPSRALRPGEAYPEDRERGEDTDIWRRHEIGFSLNPDATPEEIGAFLASGEHGDDPWNLGAQQSNSRLGSEEQVDFSDLREQMVLIGYRRKFNLRATPRGGKGVINIEISCDHTVGCRPSDWDIDPNDERFDFEKWHETRDEHRFPETFNVEMELEHLGAGGSTESTPESSTSTGGSDRGSMWGLPSQIKKRNQEQRSPRRGAPIGYPDRRPYTKDDAESPAFGTPSFSVFYAAHNQVIDLLRGKLELPKGDLGPDVQKLEAIRDKLGLLGRREEEEPRPSLPRDDRPPHGGSDRRPPRDEDEGPRRGSTDEPPRSSTHESTKDTNRSTEESRDRSTSEGDGDAPPPSMSLYQFNRRYTKGKGDGSGLNCLLDSLCQVAPDETVSKFGGTTRSETVENMRAALVRAGFTRFRRMLDIANAEEGQAILAELDIDVVVFIEAGGEIRSLLLGRSGGVRRHLHFKGAHYSPVFPK